MLARAKHKEQGNMENNISPEQILLFGIKRNVTNLFKDYLNLLQELEREHNEALNKLVKTLPPDSQKQLYLADHFTAEKMERMRKYILSKGNDCYRSIEEQSKSYTIKFK